MTLPPNITRLVRYSRPCRLRAGGSRLRGLVAFNRQRPGWFRQGMVPARWPGVKRSD